MKKGGGGGGRGADGFCCTKIVSEDREKSRGSFLVKYTPRSTSAGGQKTFFLEYSFLLRGIKKKKGKEE